MLAEIYLLQLELAADAREKFGTKHDYNFVPFSLEAFASEKPRFEPRKNERA